ncbi:MAG: DNA-protecting protein DprA [Lachnospiraceae bacterium]|nr:DNA-protecting protein DprA [Lachnospiraceae bacterium]
MWEICSCQKDDEIYPKGFREIKSAPKLLYYKGDITICNDMVIAVIGKRDASARYLEIARRIGRILAQKGITVLNGLALGIDTAALEGVVELNGKAIAVMPGGLDEIYPKKNQELAERILKNGGCLISEYPQGTKPQRYSFVQRDRIQAMLSSKVLIVDAEKDGGTMQTVDYAVKFSKPLGCFAEKEGIQSPEGNQLLIETRKACPIGDKAALMEFLNRQDYYQMSLFG